MSFYQDLARIGSRYIGKAKLFQYGFNFSPMYRRTTSRITSVTDDLLEIRIKLPISFRNRNYVNSIFGGSMFAAVDPIPMVQLMNILGDDYVVWDKSAEVFFKRPAREDLYATFTYTEAEVDEIRRRVTQEKEFDIVKTSLLTDRDGSTTFCEVRKTIYVADKQYYKEKRKKKAAKKTP